MNLKCAASILGLKEDLCAYNLAHIFLTIYISPTKILFLPTDLASFIVCTNISQISTESVNGLKLKSDLNPLKSSHVVVHRIFAIYPLYFQNFSNLDLDYAS